MVGWTLLKNPDDWEAYRIQLAADRGATTDAINWGSGPKHYPCLVSSLCEPTKVTSCYLYVAEAMRLVWAAGGETVQPKEAAKLPSPPMMVAGHTLQDFAKSVAAHLTALYAACESLKITDKVRHEQEYLKYLALTDQYHAEDKAAIEAQLSEGQRLIIDSLFPADPDAGCAGK